MRLQWPYALFGLLIPLALVLYYLRLQRNQRRLAVRYSDIGLIRAAAPGRLGWRRYLPLACITLALTLLVLAVARPQVRVQVPTASSAVVLAVDVSGSMCATDVDPNRLAAAQKAVRQFVDGQSSHTKIGLVVFSGFAQLAVAPTTDHDALNEAIDSLTVGRGTAIGAAILKSVDAIAAINPNVPAVGVSDGLGTAPGDSGDGTSPPAPAPAPAPSAPAQTYQNEIVVLLTDGANTRGVTAEQAAAVAASRGVRVYPIGFGTTQPTRLVCTAEQLGGMHFEAQGADSTQIRPSFLVVDEASLRQVAATTGGQYFAAEDSAGLTKVLNDLPIKVDLTEQNIELGAVLAGLALLFLLLGIAAAARWSAFPS